MSNREISNAGADRSVAHFPALESSWVDRDFVTLLMDEATKISVDMDSKDYQKVNSIFIDEVKKIVNSLPEDPFSALIRSAITLHEINLYTTNITSRTEGYKSFFYACQKVMLNMSRVSNLNYVRVNSETISKLVMEHFIIPPSESFMVHKVLLELSSFWVSFDQLSLRDKPNGVIKMSASRAVSIVRTLGLTQAIVEDQANPSVEHQAFENANLTTISDLTTTAFSNNQNPFDIDPKPIRDIRLSMSNRLNKTKLVVESNALESYSTLTEEKIYDLIARVFNAARLSSAQKDKYDDTLFTQGRTLDISRIFNSSAVLVLYLMDTDSLSDVTVTNIAAALVSNRESPIRVSELVEVFLIVNSIITFFVYSEVGEPFKLSNKEILKHSFIFDGSCDKANVEVSNNTVKIVLLNDRDYKTNCCLVEATCAHGLNPEDFLLKLESCDGDLIVT